VEAQIIHVNAYVDPHKDGIMSSPRDDDWDLKPQQLSIVGPSSTGMMAHSGLVRAFFFFFCFCAFFIFAAALPPLAHMDAGEAPVLQTQTYIDIEHN
jgi:hypothetical protein